MVNDILKKYSGNAIRLSLLSSHYRQPMDWSEKILDQTKKTLTRFNKILEVYQQKSAIKDNITTDDVAKVVYFLLSDYSNAITGQTIYVDNGFNIIGY